MVGARFLLQKLKHSIRTVGDFLINCTLGLFAALVLIPILFLATTNKQKPFFIIIVINPKTILENPFATFTISFFMEFCSPELELLIIIQIFYDKVKGFKQMYI